jgi:hypothetical protein
MQDITLKFLEPGHTFMSAEQTVFVMVWNRKLNLILKVWCTTSGNNVGDFLHVVARQGGGG